MSESIEYLPSSQQYVSPQEFAAQSGLSLSTVWRYLKTGRIHSVQPGGNRCRVLVPSEALAQFTSASAVSRGADQQVAPNAGDAPAKRSQKACELSGPRPRWKNESSRSD